jgi:hypothetical protein
LDGFVFEGCDIIGPAVLAILNNVTITYNQFDGDLGAIIWEVPISRERVIGAIGVQNCTFNRCRFIRIGLAGPPEFISKLRAAIAETAAGDQAGRSQVGFQAPSGAKPQG